MDRKCGSLFAHQTSYRDRIGCIKTPYAMTVHFVFPNLSWGQTTVGKQLGSQCLGLI